MKLRYHGRMPDLLQGERVQFECAAMRVAIRAESIGVTGKIVVTSDRLIFLPTRFTFALWFGYTDTVEIGMAELASVELNRKRSWMERTNRATAVFIGLRDGSRWRFDVHRAAELVGALDALIETRGTGHSNGMTS